MSRLDSTFPCPSCGAPVIFATVATLRKSIPVDPDPRPDGTIALHVSWDGRVLAETPPAAKRFGKTLYRHHFESCSRHARGCDH